MWDFVVFEMVVLMLIWGFSGLGLGLVVDLGFV